ncbi:MAG: hypothetical protein JOZ81_02895 [Chloroflexi bacterium]|nr:hypothetical protein [Chloroflexota bacterium]
MVTSIQAHQRALLAAIRVPIATTFLDGRIAGLNAAAVALFGSPERLHDRSIGEILPFLRDRGESCGESQGRAADANGRMMDLEVSWTRVTEGRGAGYIVYVVHDISRHAEVSRLREQLLYSVAHELRGPLMILENSLDMLGDEEQKLTPDEFASVLATARGTTGRMHTLLENLLSAGSIKSGHFVVAPREIELRAIINDALEIVYPAIHRQSQRVDIDIGGDGGQAPWVMADRRYARQVLTNLLDNASKYSPDGSVIRVVAIRVGKMMRISVEDSGPGIRHEQQAGLFERFYRVRSNTDVPGVGLGLAIAKGIVEAHGGSIGIESEPGMGTRVWFSLPAVQRTGEARDEHSAG